MSDRKAAVLENPQRVTPHAQDLPSIPPKDEGISKIMREGMAARIREKLKNPFNAVGQRVGEEISVFEAMEGGELILQAYLDYVYDHRAEYNYNVLKQRFFGPDCVAKEVTRGVTFLKAIAQEHDAAKKKTLLGIAVNNSSLSVTLDKVRRLIREDTSITPQQRAQLEKVGKLLFGLEEDDPKNFLTAVEDIYANMKFENYPTTTEATQRELTMLSGVMEARNIQGGRVLDVGCGTGRIANELVKDSRVAEVVGIDISETNLQTAKAGDSTGKVRYVQSGWENIATSVPDNSIDMVVILGRSICHMRDVNEFVNIFKSIAEKLTDRGVVVFDAPDPNKGVYLKNRLRYLHILRNLNIPLRQKDEEILPEVDHVVDSPDNGVTLYDRFVPDFEAAVRSGRKPPLRVYVGGETGLGIKDYKRVPIYGWEGAENFYFLADKLSHDEQAAQYWEAHAA